MLGTPLKEKTPGIEFAARLMERMAAEERSLYLLGAKPGVAEEAARRLAQQYPGLKIAGARDGYFREDAPVIQEISASGADVVFVCLGAPKQEKWMAQHGGATGAHLLCGLGGSLDVFGGVVERAPRFWSDHGLEWLYRLCKEPRRIGRMMKLPLFLAHVRQEEETEMKGKLIVFEGTDGSGKATQSQLLCQHLAQTGVEHRRIDFPRYGDPFAEPASLYLHGALGTKPEDVNAYAASLFFSVDRFASYKQDWGGFYEQGGLVVADRYTTSNAVHQASKLPEEERGPFLQWLFQLEYGRLGLPEPESCDLPGYAHGDHGADDAQPGGPHRHQGGYP